MTLVERLKAYEDAKNKAILQVQQLEGAAQAIRVLIQDEAAAQAEEDQPDEDDNASD